MECLMVVSPACQTSLKHYPRIQTKMAADELATVVILSELVDSDDEKPTRGPTRRSIRKREKKGFFETIIKELILEDFAGFKEMTLKKFCRLFLLSYLFEPSFSFLFVLHITGLMIVRHIEKIF